MPNQMRSCFSVFMVNEVKAVCGRQRKLRHSGFIEHAAVFVLHAVPDLRGALIRNEVQLTFRARNGRRVDGAPALRLVRFERAQLFLFPDLRHDGHRQDRRAGDQEVEADKAVAVHYGRILGIVEHRDHFAQLIGVPGFTQLSPVGHAVHGIFHRGLIGRVSVRGGVPEIHDGGLRFLKAGGMEEGKINARGEGDQRQYRCKDFERNSLE